MLPHRLLPFSLEKAKQLRQVWTGDDLARLLYTQSTPLPVSDTWPWARQVRLTCRNATRDTTRNSERDQWRDAAGGKVEIRRAECPQPVHHEDTGKSKNLVKIVILKVPYGEIIHTTRWVCISLFQAWFTHINTCVEISQKKFSRLGEVEKSAYQ